MTVRDERISVIDAIEAAKARVTGMAPLALDNVTDVDSRPVDNPL
jgi:hypothetical protein